MTPTQTAADVMFGAVLPWLCLALDPCVFSPDGRALLDWASGFAYPFIIGQTVLLLTWLVVRQEPRRWHAALGGGLLVGGLFALVLGVVLFPLSFIGLMMVIGVLGFTPLATALVFIRTAVRAIVASAGDGARPWTVAPLVIVGVVMAVGGAWLPTAIIQVSL